MQYASGIYAKRSFFAWATGVEAALADIDKVRPTSCCLAAPPGFPAWLAASPPCGAPKQSFLLPCVPTAQTSGDLAAMRAEHARLEALAKLFDCTSLLEGAAAAIRSTGDELAALTAVWRQAEAAQARIAAWNEQVRVGQAEGTGGATHIGLARGLCHTVQGAAAARACLTPLCLPVFPPTAPLPLAAVCCG